MSNNHRAQKPGALVAVAVSPDSLPSLTQMLRRVPPDCRLAFLLVPSTAEGLALPVVSPFPVELAIDRKPLEANHVYCLPSGALAECQDGCLRLSFVHGAPQRRLQRLLISLAENYGPAAVSVLLAGLEGEELTEGLLAIRGAGGVTFGEEPAYQDSVDFVLPAEAIGDELAFLMSSLPYLDENGMQPDDFLLRIFTLLRQRTGVDFAQYKPSTVGRRIKRRMLLQRFESLELYYHSLRQSPEAVDCLYQDLLITVTGLFRDPEAYEVLASRVFPSILDGLQPDQSVRIWVPGCSKGDEVYSIAITLLEVMAERHEHYGVQIFATDVNEKALERARAGLYPESLAEEISPSRMQRFFQKVERGYQISKSVREMCVFARQDLTRDPPFSRLDLVSCRNLLIYLNTALQSKILGIFHYALQRGGYLLLGASESIGRASEFFVQVDRLMRIFSRRTTVLPVPLEPFEAVSAQMTVRSAEHPTPLRSLSVTTSNGSELYKEADRLVLGRFAPPGVLINDDLEVLQFRGRTGLFLEHPPGTVTYNILKLVREGLLADLRSALQQAGDTGQLATREGVRLLSNGEWASVDLEVLPFQPVGARERYMLVLFRQVGPSLVRSLEAEDVEIGRLRQELEATREYLNSVNQEQESTLERLQAANEEVQSANEELQSTNEELETAKEELQSTNEELTTVNEELRERNLQLTRANNDLTNLLSSVNLPVVILGPDLRIRRFTPMARQVLNVIPSDVGRPIGDLRPHLDIPDLEERVQQVLDSLCPQQLELPDRDGRWFSVRIRPYRTSENRIDGAVIVFVDVDQPRRSLAQAEEARNVTQAVLEISDRPTVLLDQQLQILEVNRLFCELLSLQSAQLVGRHLPQLGEGRFSSSKLVTAVESLERVKGDVVNMDLAWRLPNKSMMRVRLRLAQRTPQPLFALFVDDRKTRGR